MNSERAYDYQHWYQLIPNRHHSEIVFLSSDEIKRILSGKSVDFTSVVIPYPVFIRLTSRSPKDCNPDLYDFNCCAHSSSDVNEMIQKSNRCKEDLEEYLRDSSPIGVVFQPFIKKVKSSSEVRLFIYQENLVAVSAVDEPNNHLSDDQLRIIKSYITSLKELNQSFNNYVADLCFLSNDEIIFIEINPYDPEITESFLFDWEDDANILFPITAH